MAYRQFRIHIVGRVILIAFNIFLLFYLFFYTSLYAVIFLTSLLPFIQIYGLIKYIEQTNRRLTRFLNVLEANAFSDRVPAVYDDCGFQELSHTMNRIIEGLADTRSEKEQERLFFQSIIQKMGIGLIAVKPDGRVDFINRSARRLLNIPAISHIRQLDKTEIELADVLMSIESGRRQWLNLKKGGGPSHLTLYAQNIGPAQREYKLLTIRNVKPELEDRELDAWRDLIRVLSHEIMNSMTPISSLSQTALALIPSDDNENSERFSDLKDALNAINRRSSGLARFVNNYHHLARIPEPQWKTFNVSRLLKRVASMFLIQMKEASILLETRTVPPDLTLYGDTSLIEQVLINIVKNAADAVMGRENPTIRVTAKADNIARVSIEVADNGIGMDESMLSKAFIPFFTTKKKGSGVGLAISRQIMRLHGGALNIVSTPDKGAVITLQFHTTIMNGGRFRSSIF